jgi:hypothetical protein
MRQSNPTFPGSDADSTILSLLAFGGKEFRPL